MRHCGCFQSGHDCCLLSSPLLVSFHISHVLPWSDMQAYVVHSPTQQAVMCTMLVCKPSMYTKLCLCTCLHLLWYRTHPVLFIEMRVIFNFSDANNDHLADFPTSVSTVYGHVLV